MSSRFRPQLDALEGREVPASFSFVLSNTGVGSGLFSTPAGVDPNQTSQTLTLSDLVTVLGGDRLNLDAPATATYANGVLVSVTATGSGGSEQLSLSGGTVTVTDQLSTYTGSVVYDPAFTEITFAMPDRTEGAISFDLPWDQIDSTLPSQTFTPTAFNLNIAGQNVTAAASVTFEYGNFTGLNFAVGAVGFYSSLSMTGLAVTAVQAWNGQALFTNATAPVPQQFVNFDFANVKTGRDYVIKLTFADGSNKEIVTISVNVSNTDNAADIALKAVNAINAGTTKIKAGVRGTDVRIKLGPNGRSWGKLDYSTYQSVGGVLVLDLTLAGPAIKDRQVVVVTGQVEQIQTEEEQS